MTEQQTLVKSAEAIRGLIDNVPLVARDRTEMYFHLQNLLTLAKKATEDPGTLDEPGTKPPPPKG